MSRRNIQQALISGEMLARPSGGHRRAIGYVERLNRMAPYAFRRSPYRVDPPEAMTLHDPVRKAG